jgi:hypothetical protein
MVSENASTSSAITDAAALVHGDRYHLNIESFAGNIRHLGLKKALPECELLRNA